ncbi:SH3 domain-containing protein [Sphingobacterium wenxiniae]|nr:hypothetical protein [Sphingobacterium wenxiniae]
MNIFRFIIILISFTAGQIAVGQIKEWKPVYTSQWGHLISSPDDSMSVIGVFSTEASVMLLDSTDTHYRIKVSNGDIGYIEKQPLGRAMFAKRSEGEPAQYFYRGREGFQAPHQYVQVSELRVREEPNTSARVVRKARLNEMMFIDYVPLYADGWVYVGDHFHEQPAYIQFKFLGMEVSYEQVLSAYLEVKGKDVEQELTLGGRLRELGWNGTAEQRKEALQYYEQSLTNAGRENPKVDIAFEKLLAGRLAEGITDYERYAVVLKQLNMHYLVKGTRLTDGKITDKQMEALGMLKVDDIPGSPECGWEPLYFYQSPGVQVAFEENQEGKVLGGVYQIQFGKGDVTLGLGKEYLKEGYSEQDFVTKFGHLLAVDWVGQPHVYRIANGDAGVYIFTFKDSGLVGFEVVYFC